MKNLLTLLLDMKNLLVPFLYILALGTSIVAIILSESYLVITFIFLSSLTYVSLILLLRIKEEDSKVRRVEEDKVFYGRMIDELKSINEREEDESETT